MFRPIRKKYFMNTKNIFFLKLFQFINELNFLNHLLPMYLYDKIKSTNRIYITRLKYNLDLEYLLNEPDKFVLHSRILKGLRSNRKVSDRR